MIIPTFWISTRWSLRLFAGWAPSCRGTGLTQGNWTVRFSIPDGLIFVTPNVDPAFLVLGHEDIEGGLGAPLWRGPLVFLPLAVFQTFQLNHPQWSFFSYDDFLALGRVGLRWLNQDLLPIKLDHIHICREWVLVELHLGTFCKFQSSFVFGWLNLSTENIAIISSIRIRIMPFTIRMLFDLFRWWYDMTTWQFDLFFLQQVIKNPIILSDVKSVAHLILSAFKSRLYARAHEWFRFRPPTLFGYTHVSLFVVRRLATIFDHINVTLISRLFTTPRKASRLFDSAFAIQSLLQNLANIRKDMTL
jgi:hypothetical protein